MGGITCNAEGFAGETGAVDVLEGGERDTNDLLSCSHYPLKGLAAGRVAGTIPHSDAASQDALDGASVEGAHDGGRGSGSSEFAEEVETLLRSYIHKCQLKLYCAKRKPYVNSVQKRRRLLWARRHLGWTITQWKRVLWSDESVFQVFFGEEWTPCAPDQRRKGSSRMLPATSPKARVCHGMGLCQCPWQR